MHTHAHTHTDTHRHTHTNPKPTEKKKQNNNNNPTNNETSQNLHLKTHNVTIQLLLSTPKKNKGTHKLVHLKKDETKMF